MKKLAMAIVMVLICVGAWAADPDKISFWFNEKDNGYWVYGYDGIAEGELIIPAEYDGKPVIGIWARSFIRHRLTSVIIPEGIIEIQNEAFADNLLTSIFIPNSVIRLSAGAFIHDNGNSGGALRNVSIPRHLVLEDIDPRRQFNYPNPNLINLVIRDN